MPSVIDLTGDSGRPRRIVPPAVLQAHHLMPQLPMPMPSPVPGPAYGPRDPSARLGGHRFTGSLALDILAKRRLPPRPPAPPRPAVARSPFLPFPPRYRAPRAGGYPRGRGMVGRRPAGYGRLTKNQLHGRGEHYVYKSRRKKRLFDSSGSYSAVRKSTRRKRSPAAKKTRRKSTRAGRRKRPLRRTADGGRGRLRSASKLAHAGGTRHVRTSAVTAANARTAAELVRLASALRQSSERRLRSSSRVRRE